MQTATAKPPPDSAEAVMTALAERFDGLSPQLQRAARFVIDHPHEVGVQSMRALAGKAALHPNSLVRLAQSLGFDGYDAMRERFRDFMVAGGLGGFRERARWLKALGDEGGSAGVIAGMAEATSGNLDAMWQAQDPDVVAGAADEVLGASRVYVLGMGSAYSLAFQFWYVARMAFDHVTAIPRHGAQPIDELARAGPGDLVVALTFQPYRAETMDAVRAARARGCRVVGITDSRTSPLVNASDRVLVAPTHTPQFFQSHAAVTALIEGLLAVLVARAGDAAEERIAAFHEARLEAGIYEEAAPLAEGFR